MASERDEEEETSQGATTTLDPALVEMFKQMMREERKEWEKQLDIRMGKRKDTRETDRVTDDDPSKDPRTSRDKTREYYSTGGHSVHSSRRRSRTREGPDRMVENLGGYKIKIPPFHGNNNPEEYMDWEKKCEFNFNLHHIAGANRVKLAVSEFYDYALRWWEQSVLAREINGAYPVTSWEEMKRVMRARFIPSHYQRELHSKLRKLTQGSKTVEEYYQELEVMMLRANVVEDREATMSRFLGGLNADIQDIVEMQNCVGLESMFHKAVLAEQQLKRKSTSRYNSESRRPVYNRDSKPLIPQRTELKGYPISQDKGKSDATPTTRARELKCFKCQGFGHYASECRNKKLMFIRDNGEVESEEETIDYQPESKPRIGDSKPTPVEYEAVPVTGKLLVTKRLLNTQVRTEEEDQRENLFQSRCLVKGKVCSVIIDGGSCTNVASETMVEKIGLETQLHPKPYQLQWINETGDMSVKEQVVVPLSIGEYEDEILCDVLPMDASHILLGRPWQSDRRVLHDGYANKYIFTHKDRKITLVPLTPQEVYKDQVQLAGRQNKIQPEERPTTHDNLANLKQVKGSMYLDKSILLLDFKSLNDFTKVVPASPSCLVNPFQVLMDEESNWKDAEPNLSQPFKDQFVKTYTLFLKDFIDIPAIKYDVTGTGVGASITLDKGYIELINKGQRNRVFDVGNQRRYQLDQDRVPTNNKSNQRPKQCDHKLFTNLFYHNVIHSKLKIDMRFNFTYFLSFLAGKTDLRTNPFQEGGNDMNMAEDAEVARSMDQEAAGELVAEEQLEPEEALTIPTGPITRSQTKLFNQLLGRVLSRVNQHVQEVKQSTLVCLTAQHLG